jgi:hypothetical protein
MLMTFNRDNYADMGRSMERKITLQSSLYNV